MRSHNCIQKYAQGSFLIQEYSFIYMKISPFWFTIASTIQLSLLATYENQLDQYSSPHSFAILN